MEVLEASEPIRSKPFRRAEHSSKWASSSRRMVLIDRKASGSEEALEESLASALQVADNELGQILHEVDEISAVLKGNPDSQALRVAGHPAVWRAVKQALLDRELRNLALTDDLTCLFNRRGFFAAATQQLRTAHRKAEDMLLFLCDVDNLKSINDSLGHKEGDMALIRVADALEHAFRGSDVIARLGGDEFVVLTSGSPERTQEGILRRLQKGLKKANAGTGYELSISIGAAAFDPKHPVTLGELMAQADTSLYEKKQKPAAASSANTTTSREQKQLQTVP